MASAAAQQYFNSFSPADKQNILASWNGADLMDEWYNNAVAAGAAGPGSAADPFADTGGLAQPGAGTTRYTGPANTNQWQTGVGMTDQAHPDSFTPSGDPFVDMIRAQAQGKSEDFKRFSNAQILAWKGSYDQAASASAGRPIFRNEFGDLVDKPTESGALSQAAGYATGERSAGRAAAPSGAGGYGAGTTYGPAGGVPRFDYTKFVPPLPSDVTLDPSYTFRVGEGRKALEHSAAARGTLRTSGTLQDILDYGQRAASEEYGNIFNRALATHGARYQGEKDYFAPIYGGWQTQYGGDLARWQTEYGGGLSRDLAREANIFNLLNQPAPPPPYYG